MSFTYSTVNRSDLVTYKIDPLPAPSPENIVTRLRQIATGRKHIKRGFSIGRYLLRFVKESDVIEESAKIIAKLQGLG